MPKAILEYNLPEERDEFDLAYEGARLSVIIEDLDNYLRNKVKYGYEGMTSEQYDVYESIRNKLIELRNES